MSKERQGEHSRQEEQGWRPWCRDKLGTERPAGRAGQLMRGERSEMRPEGPQCPEHVKVSG